MTTLHSWKAIKSRRSRYARKKGLTGKNKNSYIYGKSKGQIKRLSRYHRRRGTHRK